MSLYIARGPQMQHVSDKSCFLRRLQEGIVSEEKMRTRQNLSRVNYRYSV